MMIQIKPVSYLQNKFPEIENIVVKEGRPVYLTKNGYGTMAVLSLERYAKLTDGIELKLDEADKEADSPIQDIRMMKSFQGWRARINAGR